MRILIACADAFVEANLKVHLDQLGGHEVAVVASGSEPAAIAQLVVAAEAVVFVGAVGEVDRNAVADGLADAVGEAIVEAARQGSAPAVTWAQPDRDVVHDRVPPHAHVMRLPDVFGKWCPPDRAGSVAALCHGIAQGLPARIDDPGVEVRLAYIDDVVAALLGSVLDAGGPRDGVIPEYRATIGEIAAQIAAFRDSRGNHVVERVGTGFTRALYSTYLTYLDPADFAYPITAHHDPRGSFAEMLRTRDSGQVSFFTAGPGVTRGGHYHHSKTEKFLVVRGRARFRFRHVVTGQAHVLDTDDATLRIVETVPGWTHDITNTGDDEMLVMLWANEQFDPARPDTYASPL